jgi:adenylate kinase
VAAGLLYGAGESLFHFLFKSAWHGDTPALPVFGDGTNILPTIHIHDLASVVVNLADSRPSKPHYLIAVDDSKNTLREVVTAISRQLSTGRTTFISREEALLVRDLRQWEYDQLLVNLQMEASTIKDSFNIRWKAEVHTCRTNYSPIEALGTVLTISSGRTCTLHSIFSRFCLFLKQKACVQIVQNVQGVVCR